MNRIHIERALSSLPLGEIRFFETTGSTNDEALAWASSDAPELSLVVAGEQTSGRGRRDRRWYTPPDSALAMSLILHPTSVERAHPSRTTGLLALSLTESLLERELTPQIKWPNDVLLSSKKVAGILVESSWMGEKLDAMILGLGVNVLEGAIPSADKLLFPATSVETELGHPIDRVDLLKDILTKLLDWRPKLGTDDFIKAWEESLAFRGQQVQVEGRGEKPVIGELLGLEPDGGLLLRTEHGKSITVHFGEVQLRPLA